MKNWKAFTLMEIMVVIIIIGLLTGLSVANYQKSQEQAYKKNVFAQLRMIHRGQEWYKVKNKAYYPQSGDDSVTSVADINAALDIYLIPLATWSYICFDTINDETFICEAGTPSLVASAADYILRIDQSPLSDTNPTCIPRNKPCP